MLSWKTIFLPLREGKHSFNDISTCYSLLYVLYASEEKTIRSAFGTLHYQNVEAGWKCMGKRGLVIIFVLHC